MAAHQRELSELLHREDDCFLAQFAGQLRAEILADITDEWLHDQRPWARSRLLDYISIALTLTGHEVVFRKILRHAETANDHELMSYLLVELDRSVRRQRVVCRRTHDGRAAAEEILRACPNRRRPPEAPRPRVVRHPVSGRLMRWMAVPRPPAPTDRLFTQTTRAWLRRRVWRYFRTLGRNAPEAWLAAIGAALIRYTDDDLADGDQVVDNRSLMHVAFFHCSAMTFGPRHVDIDEGVSVFDLPPAPWQPELWKSEPGYDTLLNIATTAGSRFVSLWAMELLESDHAERLRSLDASTLMTLLRNDHSVIREFAVETLESRPAFDLFSSDQLICLATHADPTVSAIGFRRFRGRHEQSPVDEETLSRLAKTACPETSAEITLWALRQLTAAAERRASAQLSVDHGLVVAFFESQNHGVRKAAFAWLDAVCSESSSDNRPVASEFWNRLAESPVSGVATTGVRVLRSHWSGMMPVEFADVARTVVTNEVCGPRNRAWAISQLASLSADSRIRPSVDTLSVIAAALRSDSSELRRAALVAAARLNVNPNEPEQPVPSNAAGSG